MTFSTSQCQNPKDKVYGLQGLLAPDVRIRIDYVQSAEAVFHDAADLMRKDLHPATPARFGKSLEQFNYTKSAEAVLLEGFLVLNAEAESIIGLPQITALAELGTEMRLDTQQLYAAWIRNQILRKYNLSGPTLSNIIRKNVYKFFTAENISSMNPGRLMVGARPCDIDFRFMVPI